MGPQAKSEYLALTRDRYLRAKSRTEKGRLLREAMSVTGYHRKALIRAWRRPERAERGRRRRGRARRYGPAVIRALKLIWVAAGYPWSARLKALLPLWLPWARKRLSLKPAPCWAKARCVCRKRSTACGPSCRFPCVGSIRITSYRGCQAYRSSLIWQFASNVHTHRVKRIPPLADVTFTIVTRSPSVAATELHTTLGSRRKVRALSTRSTPRRPWAKGSCRLVSWLPGSDDSRCRW